MLDVAGALDAALLLVAADTLGVLSYTLTAVAAVRAAGLRVASLVLTRPHAEAEPSHPTNATILRARLGLTPRLLPHLAALSDDAAGDARLADAVEGAGILDDLDRAA